MIKGTTLTCLGKNRTNKFHSIHNAEKTYKICYLFDRKECWNLFEIFMKRKKKFLLLLIFFLKALISFRTLRPITKHEIFLIVNFINVSQFISTFVKVYLFDPNRKTNK